MRKLIFLTYGLFVPLLFLQAQNSPSGTTNTLSAAEANKLNGTAQPTINGKPYSQYKAEQEALTRQTATLKQTNYVSPISATPPEPTRTVAPAPKPDNNQAPAVVEGTLTKTTVAQPKLADAASNQSAPVALLIPNGSAQIDVPSPVLNIPSLQGAVKPIELKGTSLESVAKTQNSDGKSVAVKAEGSIASDAPKAAVAESAKAVSATPVAPQEPAKADAPSPKVKAAPGQGN